MGSSFSSSNNSNSSERQDESAQQQQQRQSMEDYVNLERDQVLGNQLQSYCMSLKRNQDNLNAVEKSFIPVARSSIINIVGKKQCESYLKYNSFTLTDFNILRSIHKIPHFNVDKHSEISHLITPLKKAFQMGCLKEVSRDIKSVRNDQAYKGCSFTTIDYQLLDILEYMTDICLSKKENNEPSDVIVHWLNIFDILFRGTNIKISRINNGDNEKLANSKEKRNTNIVFKCHSQNRNSAFELQNYVELSSCSITLSKQDEPLTSRDDKEAIFQSESIVNNKSILDNLVSKYSNNNQVDIQELYPIGMHLINYTGYMYTIKHYKGVYIASQACQNTIFIPQTIDEFHTFLYHDRVLEMFCNLKRHYVSIAKIIRNSTIA